MSSPTTQSKIINPLVLSFLHSPTLTSIHGHWKNRSLNQTNLCWQSNVSAYKLSRLLITFLPRSKCLLISQLQSPSAVILDHPPQINLTLFPLFPNLFPALIKGANYLHGNMQRSIISPNLIYQLLAQLIMPSLFSFN